MAQIIVYVKLNAEGTGLALSDSEGNDPGNDDITTNVDPSDVVKWTLAENSGIYSLENVVRKATLGTVDLFIDQPRRTRNGAFSASVVQVSPGIGSICAYDIWYKKDPNGPVIKIDPKIKMRS